MQIMKATHLEGDTDYRSSQASWRTTLVVMLTFVTGATDATAFEKLGSVFTSVMTGNLVLLGLAVGRGNVKPIVHVSLALAAYVVGAMVGGRIAGPPEEGDGHWPLRLTIALILEFSLFAGFGIFWELSGAHPSGALQSCLLMACAVALGVQSSATLRLGISGLSTTYLTGTLTNVVHSAVHGRFDHDSFRGAFVLVALVSGAGVGGGLAVNVPTAAPIPQLTILACVIGCGFVLGRRHEHQTLRADAGMA
jgi:uncharacterized membrane protein YoaK (UPF0700 family)